MHSCHLVLNITMNSLEKSTPKLSLINKSKEMNIGTLIVMLEMYFQVTNMQTKTQIRIKTRLLRDRYTGRRTLRSFSIQVFFVGMTKMRPCLGEQP